MGSFDIACGISHTMMNYEDKVGFVILKENTSSSSDFATFGIYAHSKYIPEFAPIYGEYDDYGRLTNYEDTYTVKYLESTFKKPIATVMECIGNSGRGLYDSYGPIYETYFGMNQDETYNEELRSLYSKNEDTNILSEASKVLEAFGFIRQENTDNDIIYSYTDDFIKYRRVKEITVKIEENTDNDNFIKYIIIGEEENKHWGLESLLNRIAEKRFYPGYGLFGKEAHRLAQSKGMFFSQNIQQKMMDKPKWLARDFPRYSPDTFEECFDELATAAKKAYSERDEAISDKLIFNDLQWQLDDNYIMYKLNEDFRWNMNSILLELATVKNCDSLKNDLKNLLDLDKILSNTNNYFEPALNGSQHGNSKAEKLLAKSILSHLKEKELKSDW